MTKTHKILIILLVVFQTTSLFSQDIRISWGDRPPKVINPGSTSSASLIIQNLSAENISVKTIVDLPKSWFVFSTGSKLEEIEPTKSKLVLINFRAPNSTLAYTYPLKVSVVNEKDEEIKVFNLKLKIKKGFKVRIESITEQKLMTSGEEFYSEYEVINNSNVALDLKLKTKNGSIQGSDTLNLKPGQSKKVKISSKSPISYSGVRNHVYGLIAESPQFDTTTTNFQNVEVYPNQKYRDDPYKRFPVDLSLNYLGREASGQVLQALQAELFARGSLLDSVNDKLEFRMRGPDRAQYALFGNFEEYYAKYQHPKFNIWVGDQPLTVTELTESGRYVRGITGSYRSNRFEYTGFYGRIRFFPEVKNEYGAKLEYQATERLRFGTATLIKEYNAEDSSAIVPTVYSKYISQKFRLNSELSYGVNGDKEGYAFKVSASTSLGKFRGSASVLAADRYYPGFFSNSQVAALNLSYRFNKLTLGVNSNYRNSNPQLDTFFVAAPFSYNALLNATYRLNSYSTISMRTGQTRRLDRFVEKRFDYAEFINRLTYEQDFENWNYSVFGEYGRTNNFLFDTISDLASSYSGGASSSFSLNSVFRISLSAVYQNSNRYDIARFSNFIASGRLFWQYGFNSRVSVGYRNNYDYEDYFQTQDQLELLVDQNFRGSHKLSLALRYAKPRGLSTTKSIFANFRYTYTFDLPTGKKKNQGKITGMVFDQDSTRLEDVRFRINGEKALTDERGVFVFSKLAPGTYYMTVERSSLGVNQISAEVMPMKVKITEQDPFPTVNVKIVEAGNISGNIKYPRVNNSLIEKSGEKIRPVYIEINNGRERKIQQCDSLGNFSFQYLRPGKWKVRLIESTLDDNFIYTKTKINVDVEPGETKTLQFKARRKQKQLRMISPPIKLTATINSKSNGGTK